MTPELKTACEVVFQEHKSSRYPVTWNRDAFRGRISTGLSEMAKETLIKKNIIQFPNPSKKIITVLNPAVAHADTYEEAEDILLNKITSPAPVLVMDEQPVYTAKTRSVFVTRSVNRHPVVSLAAATNVKTETMTPVMPVMQMELPQVIHHDTTKWYMKPVFVYGVWPICAAVVGGLVAYLMGSAYTELVFDFK